MPATHRRFNLKLTVEFKPFFAQPYEKYINSLLKYANYISTDKYSQLVKDATKKTPGASNRKPWTIWLNTECRDLFLKTKESRLPSVTYRQFINILLNLKAKIDSGKSTEAENKYLDEQRTLSPLMLLAESAAESSDGDSVMDSPSSSSFTLAMPFFENRLLPPMHSANERKRKYDCIDVDSLIRPLRFDTKRPNIDLLLQPRVDPFEAVY